MNTIRNSRSSHAKRLAGGLFFIGLIWQVSASASDVFNGKALYEQHCSSCHGLSGEGTMPGMANFARGEGLAMDDRALADTIRQGRGVMPGFGGILREEHILDIVAHLRTLL